ncbi:carbamoyltransferase HypF [Streptomyces rubellomurinus]|uniref:Carbamoyltransferase n=1 Tax=Streptomyces rubellomurinus (strain ATCC 31215) TaxID=359131 RepID=A0A0F2TGT5_STRR3|nr:carbamoyltransferase HypF [Streptomyces rubellomurinus]KJS61440.1 hydrogenase maturation protein HypF [Streptomyces rubellomurinus]
MTTAPPSAAPERRRVAVRGLVQGVGFRPFVFTLATELGLAGSVTNTGEGVLAEVEGSHEAVAAFCRRIVSDAPPLADVTAVEHRTLAPTGTPGFVITPSRPDDGPHRTLIPPDTATCTDCLAELADPADRRYRHPFISCTNCGPRHTIVTALPYDRANTTMAAFAMCPDCTREYTDPGDRRFHAQPVACHTCGPTLSLSVPGLPVLDGEEALAEARRLIACGAVLAVKSIGGYHLACDATNADTVALLRRRKRRGDKPFALMARDLQQLRALARSGAVRLGPVEEEVLTGKVRPIVLLRRGPSRPPELESAAPRSPDLGVMLPYTPLHHLLLAPPGPALLVMTSANLSGEPIVTDDQEALTRLAPLVDGWLTHNRAIHVPCEDSVVRMVDADLLPVRRSRGYVPLPVPLPLPVRPALAAGGDLKNTFALAQDGYAWLSAHIGDMDDLATLKAFDRAVEHLGAVTGVQPEVLVVDRHPGYRSARHVRRTARGREVREVQHHHAHIASVMAEHGLDGTRPVLGLAFDGTGYGTDGAVWGGEVLLADYRGFRRTARLGYVPLPGGDATVARPYRMALAHLWAAGLPWSAGLAPVRACPPDELRLLSQQLERSVNCVPTSSMGRLFDAVSALAGICQKAGYEAQAAIELEAAALAHGPQDRPEGDYAFELVDEDGVLIADPGPLIAAVVADARAAAPPGLIATRFHAAVVALVRAVCDRSRQHHGVRTVALSGGVFANALLSSACAHALAQDGFTVLRHRRVPPNDAGLALGQLMVAARADT